MPAAAAEKPGSSSKLCVLHIVKTDEGKYRVAVPEQGTKEFPSVGALIRSLREAEFIQDCLHPSEYDRSDSLLLCRSVKCTTKCHFCSNFFSLFLSKLKHFISAKIALFQLN